MTLSLAIIINVLADLALVGGLAYLMARTTRLRPHIAAADAAVAEPIRASSGRQLRPVPRTSSALAPVAA